MRRAKEPKTEQEQGEENSKGEKARKPPTLSFILELPLVVNSQEAKQLRSRFEAARNLYNALLGEAMRRLKAMRNSSEWQAARALPNKTKEEQKARRETFKEVRTQYNFSEYALHKFATKARTSWLKEHLDSMTAQTLASRAFNAANKVCFGDAKKVRFKSKGRGLDSLTGKNNTTGIRFELDLPEVGNNGRLVWSVQLPKAAEGKGRGGSKKVLELPAILDWQDPVVRYGLSHRIKYTRLVRRKASGPYAKGADCAGYRYYAQLVLEGVPYRKPKNEPGQAIIGLDLGPQTIAIVSQDASVARLEVFCDELAPDVKVKRQLQRKLDRQRRANNPDNYDEKGSIKKVKKGEKRSWNNSKSYLSTRRKIAGNERRIAAHRKSLHGRMANEIVRAGNTVKLEKVSYQAWQKQFGRSVGLRGPGMFKEILESTVARTGGTFLEFSTHKTKLSQVCHNCKREVKKPLSQRWHKCECGVGPVQRDLYSGWLASHVDSIEQTLSTTQCRENWEVAEPRLSAVMDRLTQQASERRTGFPRSVGIARTTSAGVCRRKAVPRLVRTFSGAKPLRGEPQRTRRVNPVDLSRGEVQRHCRSYSQKPLLCTGQTGRQS